MLRRRMWPGRSRGSHQGVILDPRQLGNSRRPTLRVRGRRHAQSPVTPYAARFQRSARHSQPMPHRRWLRKQHPFAWTPTTSPVVDWTGIFIPRPQRRLTFGASNWTDSVIAKLDRQFRKLRICLRRNRGRQLPNRVARVRRRGRRRLGRCQRLWHLHGFRSLCRRMPDDK